MGVQKNQLEDTQSVSRLKALAVPAAAKGHRRRQHARRRQLARRRQRSRQRLTAGKARTKLVRTSPNPIRSFGQLLLQPTIEIRTRAWTQNESPCLDTE